MDRPYWLTRARALLDDRSVLWLSGVRRAGKTTLCHSLGGRYFDCELPRVRRALEDPELFFRDAGSALVVLDEVHRLMNPSEVLKIAADHFPATRVVATGSSTLAARRKFRDTLAGRKHTLWLVPSILADLRAFPCTDLNRRMLHGGLPPFLLAETVDDDAWREWIDSYWAKDLQELFVVDKKAAFIRFVELLFRQSGELFEATALAGPCQVSRPTIQHYLEILETTLLAVVVRPFSGGGAAEIKAQPKVYAFDTGLACYFREWANIRPDDRGPLLEHLVLNELLAAMPRESIYYWRDKQKRQVDFVTKPGRGAPVTAIECKVNSARFDPAALRAFRALHPGGKNLVVCLDLAAPYSARAGDLEIRYVPFDHLDTELEGRIVP